MLKIVELDLSTSVETPSPQTARNGHEHAEPVPLTEEGPGFVAGVVKWFNNERGYGFVCPQDVDKDVFVHAAILRRNGVEALQPGQTVRIRIGEGPKGLQVTDIRLG